jgi:hypothetical protein
VPPWRIRRASVSVDGVCDEMLDSRRETKVTIPTSPDPSTT